MQEAQQAQLNKIERAVGRVEGTLEQVVPIIVENRKRVGVLERWRSGIVAIGAAITTALGLMLSGCTHLHVEVDDHCDQVVARESLLGTGRINVRVDCTEKHTKVELRSEETESAGDALGLISEGVVKGMKGGI